MINKPLPFKGLNTCIRIPITIPVKGRGFIDQGSRLQLDRDVQVERPRRAFSAVFR